MLTQHGVLFGLLEVRWILVAYELAQDTSCFVHARRWSALDVLYCVAVVSLSPLLSFYGLL